MTEQEFEQAVVRIRDGDKDGLKEIYLAYVKFIYAVIYEILQNKENTEDVTSEFFIKLWDVAERYEPGHGHRGYLATIARNMAIDFIRKRRREVLDAEPDLGRTRSGGTGIFAEQDGSLSAQDGSLSAQDGGFGRQDGSLGVQDGGLSARDSGFGRQDGSVGVQDGVSKAQDLGWGARDDGFGVQDDGSDARGRTGAGGAHARGSTAGKTSGFCASDNPVEDEVIGNIALQEVLALLKDGERQIINMKILGDMTFQEISDTLHMPMGTVTWKYRNAIGKLRRCGYEQGFEK